MRSSSCIRVSDPACSLIAVEPLDADLMNYRQRWRQEAERATTHNMAEGLTLPPALELDFCERLAFVTRCAEIADDSTHGEEPDEYPGHFGEAARGENGDKKAPQAESDAHHGEGETLRGISQQSRKELRAPQAERRIGRRTRCQTTPGTGK